MQQAREIWWYSHQQMEVLQKRIAELEAQLASGKEPVAWRENIKQIADQYAIECVEFARGIPNGVGSMSTIAVKAGDTRLALHTAIEQAHLPAQPESEPVAQLRYQRNRPGHENDMPDVVSCNWLPDGIYSVYTNPQPAQTVSINNCLWARNGNQPCSGTQPAQPQPLTEDQVSQMVQLAGYDAASPQELADFINGIRHGEAAHGIKEKP